MDGIVDYLLIKIDELKMHSKSIRKHNFSCALKILPMQKTIANLIKSVKMRILFHYTFLLAFDLHTLNELTTMCLKCFPKKKCESVILI